MGAQPINCICPHCHLISVDELCPCEAIAIVTLSLMEECRSYRLQMMCLEESGAWASTCRNQPNAVGDNVDNLIYVSVAKTNVLECSFVLHNISQRCPRQDVRESACGAQHQLSCRNGHGWKPARKPIGRRNRHAIAAVVKRGVLVRTKEQTSACIRVCRIAFPHC